MERFLKTLPFQGMAQEVREYGFDQLVLEVDQRVLEAARDPSIRSEISRLLNVQPAMVTAMVENILIAIINRRVQMRQEGVVLRPIRRGDLGLRPVAMISHFRGLSTRSPAESKARRRDLSRPGGTDMIRKIYGWSLEGQPAERLALIGRFADLFAWFNTDEPRDSIREWIAQEISIGGAQIEHVLRQGDWWWELALWDGTAFAPVAGIPDDESGRYLLIKQAIAPSKFRRERQ